MHAGLEEPQRRTADVLRRCVNAALDAFVTRDLGPVRLGRALVLVAGALVGTAAVFLRPDGSGWLAVALVTPVMIVLSALTMTMDWTRLPQRTTLLFPALVCAGLAAIATQAPNVVAPVTGVLALCFVYIGITQPVGSCLIALLPATATFTLANGGWSRPVAVRLAITLIVWTLIAELLARYSGRQMHLTAALQAAAHTDALTGVPNRRDLDLRMSLTAAGDAIVVCDLDHFKDINDRMGHARGDRILADFGGMLRLALREGDYCARYGGEEFVVILPATSPANAETLVARLHTLWATLEPEATFSTGIAVCQDGRSPMQTLAAADTALYAAKAAGRNTDCLELGSY